MGLRAVADPFVVPTVSHYPGPPSPTMWVRSGEPQPRSGGEDGTNQPPLTGTGRMGREEDNTHHLEVLGLIASSCEGLTVPAGNAVPFTPTANGTKRKGVKRSYVNRSYQSQQWH